MSPGTTGYCCREIEEHEDKEVAISQCISCADPESKTAGKSSGLLEQAGFRAYSSQIFLRSPTSTTRSHIQPGITTGDFPANAQRCLLVHKPYVPAHKKNIFLLTQSLVFLQEEAKKEQDSSMTKNSL